MTKIININDYTKLIGEIIDKRAEYSLIYSYNYTKINLEYPYYNYIFNKKFFYLQKQVEIKNVKLEKLKAYIDFLHIEKVKNRFSIRDFKKHINDKFNIKVKDEFQENPTYELILYLSKSKTLEEIFSIFTQNLSILVCGLHPDINKVDDLTFAIFTELINDYDMILKGELDQFRPYFVNNNFNKMTKEELLVYKNRIQSHIDNLDFDKKIVLENPPSEIINILNSDTKIQNLKEGFIEEIKDLDRKIDLYEKRIMNLSYDIFENLANLDSKKRNKIFLLESYVAGLIYSKDYDLLEDKLNLGDLVYPLREYENEYDKNAVKIITKEFLDIGYIPKSKNKIISNLLDQNQDLIAYISDLSYDLEDLKIHIKIYLIK